MSVTLKGLGRGLDDRRTDGNGKNFFSSSERTDHPLNSHSLQWVVRFLSLGMKRQGIVTDHSPHQVPTLGMRGAVSSLKIICC